MQRSRRRRAITPEARKRVNRRRRASTALSTLMVAGPAGQILAGVTGQGTRALAASPVDRAIGGEVGGVMLLKVGSTGAAVEAVQERLRVPADGIYGPVTERAVRDFQSRSKILIDGVVGPVTWTELFGLERAAASAGTSQGAVAVVVRELEPGQAARGASARAPAAGETQTRPAVQRTAGHGEGAEPRAEPGAPQRVESAPDSVEKAPDGDTVAAPPARSEPAPPAATTCTTLRLASPVRGVRTSPFGPRSGRNHDGVDIAAAMGTAVRAAECGVVTTRGVQGGYGNMVCVKHSARFETCYAHLSSFAINAGQTVRRGQVIGYVGCTGSCTGPHLHFETRVDGQARNPDPYLAGAAVPGKPTVRPAPRAQAAKATSRQSSRSGWRPARTAVGGAPAARTAKPAPSPQAADPGASVETAAPVASPAPVPSAPHQVGAAAPAAPVAEPAPVPVAPQPVVEETPAPVVTESAPAPVAAEAPAVALVEAAPGPAPVQAEPGTEPETAPPVEAEPIEETAPPEDIATPPEEVPTPPEEVPPPEAEAQTEAPAPGPSTP